MPEKILKAVANPPTIFWAPQLPAMVNMALHALLMIYGWGLGNVSPLVFIVSNVLCHVIIAIQGAREPHLSSIIQAWAVNLKRTTNLHKGPTRKYVP
jgi:hypothetical protein